MPTPRSTRHGDDRRVVGAGHDRRFPTWRARARTTPGTRSPAPASPTIQDAAGGVRTTCRTGQVIRTDPAAGQRRRPTTTITLVVSSGQGQVGVPNVEGLTEDNARSTARGRSTCRLSDQPVNDPNQDGRVLSQNPPANTQVDQGIDGHHGRRPVPGVRDHTDHRATARQRLSLAPMARTLVLLRHGESEWNLKNLFTGWYDCDLTPHGRGAGDRRRPAHGRARPAPRRGAHVGADPGHPHRRAGAAARWAARGSRCAGTGGSTSATTATCRGSTRPRPPSASAPTR